MAFRTSSPVAGMGESARRGGWQKFLVLLVAVVGCFLYFSVPNCVLSPVQGGGHLLPRHVSLAQLRSWNRDGFLVIKNGLTEKQVAQLRVYLEEMHNMKAEKGGIWKYFEESKEKPGTKILNRIEKFASYHEGMREFISSPYVRGVAEDLLGEEVYLFKEKVNYKLPGGGGFEPHQDMQPGWDEYAPQMVSVLLCVDANTEENGALELAPGSHARPGGLIGRPMAALSEEETRGLKWKLVETQPGDLVFFDAWAPHKSSPNKSNKPRRNTYVTFSPKKYGNNREKYYAAKFKNLPPDADREEGKSYAYKV